jgi:protein TonB
MAQAIPRQAAPAPIGYALLVAAGIHGLLLLGLGFVPEFHPPEPHRSEEMKVVLVRPRAKPPEKVEQPQLLAQVNQAGSGDNRGTAPAPLPAPAAPHRQPTAPPPAPLPAAAPAPVVPEPPPLPAVEPDPPPAAPPPAPVSRAPAAPPKPKPPPVASPPKTKPEPRPAKPVRKRVSAAQLLASRSTEIARLTSELERKSAAFAQLPRRKAISAATTEYRYAAYMEAWRRKVENIGNLNYPEEARRKKLYGNLLLHVAVRSDGSVERVRLLKSSGHKLLDDAAINIIKLAAPYAPFPPDIRKEVDVLDITRTWQFLSSNRLGWQ